MHCQKKTENINYTHIITSRAKTFIDEYFENVLTIDRIAQAIQISKLELDREFKRQYGISFSQYIRDRRISEVEKLINDEGC